MKTFTAEILGRVPYGLTHNEVYATIWQVANEKAAVQSSSKRVLAGKMVSVKITFEADSKTEAEQTLRRCVSSVFNFSADIIGLREVK